MGVPCRLIDHTKSDLVGGAIQKAGFVVADVEISSGARSIGIRRELLCEMDGERWRVVLQDAPHVSTSCVVVILYPVSSVWKWLKGMTHHREILQALESLGATELGPPPGRRL